MRKLLVLLLEYLRGIQTKKNKAAEHPMYFEISSDAFVADDGGASFRGFLFSWEDGKEYVILYPDRLAHLIYKRKQQGIGYDFEEVCGLKWKEASIKSFHLLLTFKGYEPPHNVDETVFIFRKPALNQPVGFKVIYTRICRLMDKHSLTTWHVLGDREETPLSREFWHPNLSHRIAVSEFAECFEE